MRGLTDREVLRLNLEEDVKLLELGDVLTLKRQGSLQRILSVYQRLLKKEASSATQYSDQANPVRVVSAEIADCDKLSNDTIGRNSIELKDEIAVLLSGGVDSSVALKLLLDQGHKVRAYYLRIWLEDELAHLNECPWEEDMKYVVATCNQLNVSLEVVPLQREYKQFVVNYTIEEVRRGFTPNPDVMCNSLIKYGAFYDYMGR